MLTTQNYSQIVSDQAAAIQGASNALMDFSVGSIPLALIESNASIALFLQAQAAQILALTRAATSQGADLDAFGADYGFTRLPATYATGEVTFASFTNTMQAIIPVGTQVETSDGTQLFNVVADTNNPNYNAGLMAYLLNVGVSSIPVTVNAVTAGSLANVAAGSINTLVSSVPYVDTVTNLTAFTNALDAETDAAFRVRFQLYLASLARATKAAINYAVQSVQQGVTNTLTENYNYSGTPNPGYFYTTVDDGSHAPSSTFLANIGTSVEQYRGFCITYGIFAPTVVAANVNLTITTAPNYTHATITSLVQTAITNYLNTLVLGQTLPYTRLEQLAYDASPAVINVTNVMLNGATSDQTVTQNQVIVAGSVVVN